MNLPDPNKLKEITNAAIQRGKAEAEEKLRREAEAKRQREEKDQLKAKQILEEVPAICEKAASEGLNKAIVLEVKSGDYSLPNGKPVLRGAAALVFNALKEANLHPILDEWDDGCGMKSGWNIVVQW